MNPVGSQNDAGLRRDSIQARAGGQRTFGAVQSFCLFVGHTRSGHSLVGALVDAHPNAVVPHELKVFGEGNQAGELAFASRKDLLKTVVKRSARQAKAGRRGTRRTADGGRERVSYAVADQWQGRFSELLVVGTKHAQEVAQALSANAAALDELRKQAGIPVRLVNVVRNPWDNVASMAKGVPVERAKLRAKVLARYLFRSQMLDQIRKGPYEMLDVALEDLSADPPSELTRICGFLGLEAPADYLDACASVVEPPNETRLAHEWTAGEVEAIEAAIDGFPWLERYRSAEMQVPA